MVKSGPHRPRAKALPVQKHRNFVKQWRIYREMTVEELAEAAEMSTGNISALENQRQGYSPEGLEKLAKALKTTRTALLEVDPESDRTKSFWQLWARATPDAQETLTIMAERLVGPGGSKR